MLVPFSFYHFMFNGYEWEQIILVETSYFHKYFSMLQLEIITYFDKKDIVY